MIFFSKENNLELPKKYNCLTKYVKYFLGIPYLRIKVKNGTEIPYLFDFIKIPRALVNMLLFLKIKQRQIFSISNIDYHRVIFLFGIQIRSKIKTPKTDIKVTENGLNSVLRKPRIIASLTTFPERINSVKETIKTLLTQSVKPDELILWLAKEQFPTGETSLPKDLLELKKYGLSIKWCKDLKSYKKLVPALKEYPEDIIITFDDDIYYDNNVIENLYNSYLDAPHAISANRSWRLQLSDGRIKPLKAVNMYWSRYADLSYKNTIIGCGGVLYPPKSLDARVTDEEAFQSIIPTQDDIWFWAMAVLNGTKIKVVSSYDMQIRNVENTQQYGLCKLNKSGKKGLDGSSGFKTISDAFPELAEKIKGECNE